MEEGKKSQLIFGWNVAGNNFMHAKTKEGSLFSKSSRLFEMAVSQEKQLKAHTHTPLYFWSESFSTTNPHTTTFKTI